MFFSCEGDQNQNTKPQAAMDRACLFTAAACAVYFFIRIMVSPSAWLARADYFSLLAALLTYLVTALLVRRDGTRCAAVCGLIGIGWDVMSRYPASVYIPESSLNV